MKSTKRQILAQFLAAWMALQPMYLVAADETKPSTSAADVINSVNGAVKGVLGQVSQVQAQQQANVAAQASMNALNPNLCGGVQCHDDIFKECNALASSPNIIESQLCTIGFNQSAANAPALQGQLQGLVNNFKQVSLLYNNFQVTSTTGDSNQGLSCIQNREKVLKSQLDAKLNDFNKAILDLQSRQAIFKQQSQADLDSIQETTALLDGVSGENATANGALFKQKQIDFQNQFQDPACASVLGGPDFKSTGQTSGLKGIESKINTIAFTKSGGGNNLTAMDFNSNVVNNISKDINKLADVFAKQSQVMGIDQFSQASTDSIANVASSSNKLQNAFKEVLQDQQLKLQQDLGQIKASAAQIGADDDLVKQLLDKNDNYASRLANFERKTKNDCFTAQGPVQQLLTQPDRIFDPLASTTANKFGDSAYKNFIKSTLAKNGISMEEKIRLIKEMESSGENTRFVVRNSSSMTFDVGAGKQQTIQASNSVTPATLLTLLAQNCTAQYETNQLAGGLSGKQIVEKMQGLRAQYEAKQTTFAASLKSTVVDRLINCSDSTQSSGSVTASCSATALNTSDANFCLSKADNCARNMRSCLSKAQAATKVVEDKRSASLERYKANVTKNKQDLLAVFSKALTFTSLEGLSIEKSLLVGLELPTNTKFSFDDKDPANMIKGLTSLEVEDPVKYVQQTVDNLTKLKASVQKRNDQLLAKIDDHIKEVKANYAAAAAKADAVAQQCENTLNGILTAQKSGAEKAAADAQANQNELSKFCSNYNSIDRANPACDVEFFDTVIEAAAKLGDNGARAQIGSFKRECEGTQKNSDTDNILTTDDKGKQIIDRKWTAICKFVDLPSNLPKGILSSLPENEKSIFSCNSLYNRDGSVNEQGQVDCRIGLSNKCEILRSSSQLSDNPDQRLKDALAANSKLGQNASQRCSAADQSGRGGAVKNFIDAAGQGLATGFGASQL